MRSLKLEDHKLLRDIRGSVLVETTIVIPMFLLLVLGTIDVTYMFFDWTLANKAAYMGARTAVVSNPVAPNIVNLTYTPLNIGQPCFGSTDCPSVPTTGSIDCTSVSPCSNGGGYSAAAFNTILAAMQKVFPQLTAKNVQISYQTNGSGFVGQTYYGNSAQFSLPMNVTVQIQCMTHQFYFLSGLMRAFYALMNNVSPPNNYWVFSTPTDAQGNLCSPAPTPGPNIPAVATTMQSESLFTD
jgi:Flp pilus assembly protein TadG